MIVMIDKPLTTRQDYRFVCCNTWRFSSASSSTSAARAKL
jgi:hypothetical protein